MSCTRLPPTPITIDKLRKGKYKPCSRNPVLAQCLSYFHRILPGETTVAGIHALNIGSGYQAKSLPTLEV